MLVKEMFYNKRYFLLLFLILFFFETKADDKKKIISNFQNIKNLTFNFEQNINGKIENGNCTIEYPKKILLVSLKILTTFHLILNKI